MGKIFKNPNPKDTSKILSIPTQIVPTHATPNPSDITSEYSPTVLSKEQFEPTLKQATELFTNHQYKEALPLLLNLEVTDFNNIEVHEMLADVFLHLNHLTLAKEQCQIYSQLLQTQISNPILRLKSFDELIEEAGDLEDLQQEFEEFQKNEVSYDNFYHGTSVALKIATHYMATEQYKQAEDLLTTHRDKYLLFLESEEGQ